MIEHIQRKYRYGLSHIPDAENSMHVVIVALLYIFRDCKMTLQLGDMLANRMCCHISIVDALQDIKPIREPALDLCRMSR